MEDMLHTWKGITMQSVSMKAGLVFTLLWSAMSAHAQTLDQSYTAIPTTGLIVSSDQTLAQTFTVTRNERLQSVAVQVARNPELPSDDLVLEIRSTQDDGRPSDNILATASLAADTIPFSTEGSFVSFDVLSAGIDLRAGDLMSIVLRTDAVATGGNVNPYAWYADDPGNYTGGIGYVTHSPDRVDFGATSLSFGFRTYTTSIVPAPGALLTALMGAAPGAALLLRRRRKQ